MPAPRKPEGQRVRRNLSAAKVQLPFDGYSGPIPKWPLSTPWDSELELWNRLWRTPQAAVWAPMGIEDVVARYVQVAIELHRSVDGKNGKVSMATAQMYGELRQLEDRLGRNPRAMKSLDWEVEPAPEGSEVTPINRDRRRLRAVDEAGA